MNTRTQDRQTAGGPATNELVVESVDAEGTRVTATVEGEGDVARFVRDEPFFAEYDVDVSDVPEGVLAIPVLAQICPVAWAAGADVRASTVDRRFLDSLQAVGRALHEMYPGFIAGGRIVVDEATDADASGDGTATLFTGGVDSLATYVRHRDEDPTLVNVQGWTVGIDDDARWAATKERIRAYGERFDADTQFVRSNMLEFLETPLLSAHFADRHDGGWYSAVGGGLGILGLCAPLTVASDIGTVYIGATVWEGIGVPDVVRHWEGRGMPWGSHPDIDDEVAWAGTECVHDAFELSRQEHVEVVADFIASEAPDLPVRACEDSSTADNCSACEKCARTAFGLTLTGLDPGDHGFEVDREFFERAREGLASGAWLPDEHTVSYWADMRDHVDPAAEYPVEGAADFAAWLVDADLSGGVGASRTSRLVRTVARNVPYPAYRTVYPGYRAIRRRLG